MSLFNGLVVRMIVFILVIFVELIIIGKLNFKDILFIRIKFSKSLEINIFKMVLDIKYKIMVINILYKYRVWNYFLIRVF